MAPRFTSKDYFCPTNWKKKKTVKFVEFVEFFV